MSFEDKQITPVHTLKQLKGFAQEIADHISFPTVILLFGEMGCGKTQFTQFLVSALKARFVDRLSDSPIGQDDWQNPVISPTFTLHNTYSFDTFDVEHFDLFRLKGDRDIESVGLWDVFTQKQVIVVIEWAEKLKGVDFLPSYWKRIELSFISKEEAGGSICRYIHF